MDFKLKFIKIFVGSVVGFVDMSVIIIIKYIRVSVFIFKDVDEVMFVFFVLKCFSCLMIF